MLLKTTIVTLMLLVNNISCLKEKSCSKHLRQYANDQMLLIHCITINSVPVTMCMNCYGAHQDALKAYDILATDCKSDFFDNDRINLVSSTESALMGLWSKAYCDDCFNNNNSIVFGDKNLTFYTCLNGSKDNPCEKCKSEYNDLNNFYINLDQHNNGEVCYDLQDSMNRTRNLWSKKHKCCRREYNMTLFTIALCVTFCFPLLFYGSTYLITIHQERNHDVLSDEEPQYNSSLPSTSCRANMNNINNPTQSTVNNGASSRSESNNPSTSKYSLQKNDFNILKEDLESSDDEILVKAEINSKGKLKEIS